MDFFHQTVNICSWFGIAPVKKCISKKGVVYERSRRALVVMLIQLVMVGWMVVHFHFYMIRKDYYPSVRKFQVTVLMYCEVCQSLGTLICTLFIKLPHMTQFLAKCVKVITDLGGTKASFVVRHSAAVTLLAHLLITLYRAKDSIHRVPLMIPFWAGMTQVIMVHVLLFAALTLVDMSSAIVNQELQQLLTRRPDKDQDFLVRRLLSLMKRQASAVDLFSFCRYIFGPDVFLLCIFFLFKISFICYHIYYRTDSRLWGQNTMVGELTGFFQILQLLMSTFWLGYVSDNINRKIKQSHVLLLTMHKERRERVNSEIRNLIKAFILQIKSQPHTFSVCGHFNLNRALLYDMVLGAVTYVFILIQFQGIN